MFIPNVWTTWGCCWIEHYWNIVGRLLRFYFCSANSFTDFERMFSVHNSKHFEKKFILIYSEKHYMLATPPY